MLILIIAVILVVLVILWFTVHAAKVAGLQESQQDFPSIDTTVSTPKKDVEKVTVWYNLNGVPHKVFMSKRGALYIERKKVRDGSIYKDYLSTEEKSNIYYDFE